MPPIIKGIAGGAIFTLIAYFFIYAVLPAWAVTFPVGPYVVDLGALAPWIGIVVTLFIWWDARKAKQKAAEAVTKVEAVAVQIDGLLADRDRAKVVEGEVRGEKRGADAALQLAEGQRQGIEMAERASAVAKAASEPTRIADPSAPLPVADDRTATASERVAEATERSAVAGERVAQATEEQKKGGDKP